MRILFSKVALVTSLGLVLAFTFGCSPNNSNDDSQSSSSKVIPNSSSSSSFVVSSSSLANISSSSYKDTYLGYGYDVINSSYINRSDVKILYPILDQKRMIDDNLVFSGQIGGIQKFETFVGNSLTKFYEERNEHIGLGLNANVPFKGVLFSGKFETEFNVSLNSNRIDNHTYLRGRSYHYTHHEYIGNGFATAERLVEYLNKSFSADLRSKTATQILDRYGSHVFIQYYKGGAMEYNYAYYGTELANSTTLSNALSASLSVKIGTLSAGVSSNSKEEEKCLREELENNSTFHSYTYGGTLVDISSVEQIANNYSTWLNSINDKSDICGIGKFDESFIPVWELAAASNMPELADELEMEFLDRVARQGKNLETSKQFVIEKEFTTAGNQTYTFDKGFPATIEVYALGAGGGGQGGHFSDLIGGGYGGTGGAGGGGAATYMKLSIKQPVTFNINVGRGGIGGAAEFVDWVTDWKSGKSGEDGENTTVTWGTNVLTAAGGKGGGGSGQIVTGGNGGDSSSKPEIVLEENWLSVAGQQGTDGTRKGDLASIGGNAGGITNKGSIDSFGGGKGGVKDGKSAEAGGGGSSKYGRNQSGSIGGDGQVIIVVTYLANTTTN